MFRTSHDSRGQAHVGYDGEFAAKQASLARARGDLRSAQDNLQSYHQKLSEAYARIERNNLVNEWRMAVINDLANAAQDEHAIAAGYKAALDLLSSNPAATREQLDQANEAARKAASRDMALLNKTVEIQTRLKPRGLC